MTNYSRSVLLSNGLHLSKNFPVKFDFSSKTVPANIAKKLPLQRCFKPLLIPIFNFSHKRHTFAFAGESGYTTRLSAKDRTQRLTRRNRGLPSLVHSVVLCCRRYPFYSTTLLYTYISRFSVAPHYISRGKNSGKVAAINFIPNRSSLRFSASLTNGPRLLSLLKLSTHSALLKGSHTAAHTPKHGHFRWGTITTLGLFHTFTNIPGPGVRTANFAAFGAWSGGAPKERRKPSEQRCAYARRCSEASRPRWAALPCLQFGDVAVFHSVRSTF